MGSPAVTTHKAVTIGVIDGGASAESGWPEALAALRSATRDSYEGHEAQFELNVVFHVPGEYLNVDFEGMRTGSFSRRKAVLAVQVALPVEAPVDVDVMLRTCVWDAIEMAEEFLYQEGLDRGLLATARDRFPI